MILPQNRFVLIKKDTEPEEKSGILLAARPKAVNALVIESDAEEVEKGDTERVGNTSLKLIDYSQRWYT